MMKVRILGVPLGLGTGHVRGSDHDWEVRTDVLTDALRSANFEVEDCGSLSVPYPAGIGDSRAKFLREIVSVCDQASDWAFDALEGSTLPLLVGGDHSIAIGSIAGVADHFRRKAGRVGVIWLDAHADMNTPSTSPSGRIHGMALAACLGLEPMALSQLRGFSPKIDPRNVAVIGAREIDGDEVGNIERSGIKVYTMRDIDERGMAAVVTEAIQITGLGTVGIHLSLDVDVLDPSVAPGVSTPVLGGLTYREAHLVMEILADSKSLISMDLVEFNPALDKSDITSKVSTGLVLSAFGKSIFPRAW